MSRDLNSANLDDVEAVAGQLRRGDLSHEDPAVLLEFFNAMLDRLLD